MKTASKNSAKTNVENPELHFHFNWNPPPILTASKHGRKKMQNMPPGT